MKYIAKLHELRIFQKKDAVALIGNKNAAKEILRRYKKQGLIYQIRRNLYVATDLANKVGIVSKFEIAGKITPSSYLSYHTALEYHGLAHQIFYEMYISSKETFNNFDYSGITYTFCRSKSDLGIITPVMDSLVRTTDLERTVLDCINRIDLSGGLKELIECLAIITYINENKLVDYLGKFDKQFLYQKTGFLLSYFRKEMRLSNDFFELCKSKTGINTRYLINTRESSTYFKDWKLCAPKNILSFLEQEREIISV
jgi:predicted transcriptional regulator of viral defense system